VKYWAAKGFSVGALAINWAVNSFVIVLVFAIVLGQSGIVPLTFREALVAILLFAAFLHGTVMWACSSLIKRRASQGIGDSDGIKILEYTVSVVCWGLQLTLWWFGAEDATAIFTLVPTYFVTSLLIFHESFRYSAGLEVRRKTLLVLAGNIFSVGHAIVVVLKARAAVGA
jgi:hypothetical protein